MPDLGLLGWIVVGLIAGALSGALVGGRTARGCLPNIVIGIVGGWFAEQLGFGPTNGLIAAIVVATLGSILVRLVLGAVEDRR